MVTVSSHTSSSNLLHPTDQVVAEVLLPNPNPEIGNRFVVGYIKQKNNQNPYLGACWQVAAPILAAGAAATTLGAIYTEVDTFVRQMLNNDSSSPVCKNGLMSLFPACVIPKSNPGFLAISMIGSFFLSVISIRAVAHAVRKTAYHLGNPYEVSFTKKENSFD